MRWRLDREWPALAALAVLYIFLAIAAPSFYHFENLRDLALANVPVLLVAAGMTFIIVIGQIDISVGSLFAVTSVAFGVMVKAGLPLVVASLAALLIGAVLGSINGGLISFVRAVYCCYVGHYDRLARSAALEHGRRLGRRLAGEFSVVWIWTTGRASRHCLFGAFAVRAVLVGIGKPFGFSRHLRERV